MPLMLSIQINAESAPMAICHFLEGSQSTVSIPCRTVKYLEIDTDSPVQ